MDRKLSLQLKNLRWSENVRIASASLTKYSVVKSPNLLIFTESSVLM